MTKDPTKSLAESDDKLTLILAELRTMNARMENFEKRQGQLEDKVDARLRETRPIWEQVLSRLDRIEQRLEHVEQRLERIEQRQESMDRRVRWVYDEVKELKMRLRPLASDMVKLLNDRDDFEERILKLETERS
jgi:chromosome segregation ATPase